jgi:ribosomal protein S18 acetylase RimI-like enzyme
MQRKGLDDLPAAPLPSGIELLPVQPEHLRPIWDAKEEAFQDHWGFTPKFEADYVRWVNDPTHDFSLWVVAWQDGQVAGISLNVIYPEDNSHYGFLRGEIHSVGVRRPWRGRGLGRALIVESLRVLREHGMTEAVLGVDSDSLTGALRLYESAGFRTIAQDWILRKPFA